MKPPYGYGYGFLGKKGKKTTLNGITSVMYVKDKRPDGDCQAAE